MQNASEFPASFIATQPGDSVAGTLVRFSKGVSAYGEKVIAVIEDPDGNEHSLWLFGHVLLSKFAELRPAVGEAIEVRYLGLRKAAAGHTYENWSLMLPDRPQGEFEPDWSALAAEAASETE